MDVTDPLAESATLADISDEALTLRRAASDPLNSLRTTASHDSGSETMPIVVVGELLALIEQGRVPMMSYPLQSDYAALRARSVIDLRHAHIGCRVVLMFEFAQPSLPIIMGVLRERDGEGWPPSLATDRVELDAGGERLIVSAKRKLVLRCGQSNVRLCDDGRIEIKGQAIVTEAVGANRIRGGSVEWFCRSKAVRYDVWNDMNN